MIFGNMVWEETFMKSCPIVPIGKLSNDKLNSTLDAIPTIVVFDVILQVIVFAIISPIPKELKIVAPL